MRVRVRVSWVDDVRLDQVALCRLVESRVEVAVDLTVRVRGPEVEPAAGAHERPRRLGQRLQPRLPRRRQLVALLLLLVRVRVRVRVRVQDQWVRARVGVRARVRIEGWHTPMIV